MDNPKPYLKPCDASDADTPNESAFLNEQGIISLLSKLKAREYKDRIERNNWILDIIRIKQPISRYELAKICNLNYSTIKQFTKWAEAADFVFSKVAMGENGLPVKLIYIDKKEGVNEKERND